jgi:general secretion pathway protein F
MMASFRYRALSATGTPLSGEMKAPSKSAVIRQLRNLGHYPISATSVQAQGWRRLLPRHAVRRRRPSLKDLSIATQELATLLKAGLELDRALGITGALGETKTMHRPLAAVRARVRDGASLAEALAAEGTFPALYISMVRAGELGGQLDKILLRLAEYLQRTHAVREAVASALVYPIILLCTAGISIIVILVFVLPQFEPLFAEAGRTLPFSTRVVMAIGHFIGGFWWLIALSIAGGVLWFHHKMKLPAFRRRRDALLLKLPLIGELLRKMDMERFSRTLGTLVANGVALPNALAITKDVLANSVIAEAVGETAVSLREGDGLAARLARSKQFPAITLDLIQVGEESGTLDEMLLRQAELCERTVKHTIDRLIALLVPILTVVLGMMVAGLIASMLVAILSVNDLAL